jgi:8-oxo-dGTP diphosphatase
MFFVGVNVLLVRSDKLLLGKRKRVFGAGTWALPGGHLEFGESMAAAAARELNEETGVVASQLEFVGLANTPKGEWHHIQIGFLVTQCSGEPILREPDLCYEWRWFGLDNLPRDIFPNHAGLINGFKNGFDFTDSA